MSQLKRLRKSGSQESSVKKHKVTSQITTPTTRSMSKKNNKTVHCHHDDDDDLYAKDGMIIEHVNDDCLAEIFMYLPTCERPKIALVCKKWKRALDDTWFNVKKLEFTYWRYDENTFFEKNYPTLDGQLNFLKSLLYKCGHYLRELDLSAYDHCNIVPVINKYCPNIEKLQIRITFTNYDNTILTNAFTNLSKLKVLKIILHDCFCSKWPSDYTTLIESLLNVADTLTDLFVSNWTRVLNQSLNFPEEMTSVVPQLKALRKFVIFRVGCLKSLRDYLNNSKTIRTIDDACTFANKIDDIMLFQNMKVLNIIDCLITDDDIYNIANIMKQLRTLYVSCSWLTDAGIVTCTKMNNLKSLTICGSNNVTDFSIKLLKNFIDLKLPRSNKITDESVIKVLKNSPKMEWFCVEHTGITHKFIENAAEISRNRKRQLELWVTLEPDMSKTQVEYEYLTVVYDNRE